jgi:hypothetical protein
MNLINRSLVAALLFLATGIGVTFAAGETSTADFLIGDSAALAEADLDEALTLLVGPPGPEGPQGAQGEKGEPGDSVRGTVLSVGDANCPTGGAQLTIGTSVVNICNGARGADGAAGRDGANGLDGAPGVAGTNGRDGANGAQGAQGPAGPAGANGTNGTGGGGTGTGYGAGTLAAGTCDDAVDVQLKHSFAGGKFSMNQIVMSALKDACAGSTMKVYLGIRTGTLYGDGAGVNYFANDEILCTRLVNNTNWTGGTADDRTMTIEGTTVCTNTTRTTTFALNLISSRDLATNVGFELG